MVQISLENDEEITIFLIEELKKNEALYTIQNKDYIGYPLEINEKILLFAYLLNHRSKFFENISITSLDYYKNSKHSCSTEELKKLSFADAMKINNNISDFSEHIRFPSCADGVFSDDRVPVWRTAGQRPSGSSSAQHAHGRSKAYPVVALGKSITNLSEKWNSQFA